MPKMNDPSAGLYGLLGLSIGIILLFLLIGLILFVIDFSGKLRYINNEIRRANGAERKHWIRERRKLWLSLLPFIKF